MSSRTDHRLIELARQGDARAWGELVDRHAGLVSAVLRAERVPVDDQPDAFQFVFVELHRYLDRLAEVQSLPGWLRLVASRHGRRVRLVASRTMNTPTGEELDAVSDEARTDASVELAFKHHMVRQAVDELSPACQDLVRQLFFEDPPRPYEEVAKGMGIAIGSIGMTRRRCLERLEAVLRRMGLP